MEETKTIIDEVLSGILFTIMAALCGYYIYIAKRDDGNFDKREFNQLVIYVMLFIVLVLMVNGKEGMAPYFGMLLGALLAEAKLGTINIGKREDKS